LVGGKQGHFYFFLPPKMTAIPITTVWSSRPGHSSYDQKKESTALLVTTSSSSSSKYGLSSSSSKKNADVFKKTNNSNASPFEKKQKKPRENFHFFPKDLTMNGKKGLFWKLDDETDLQEYAVVITRSFRIVLIQVMILESVFGCIILALAGSYGFGIDQDGYDASQALALSVFGLRALTLCLGLLFLTCAILWPIPVVCVFGVRHMQPQWFRTWAILGTDKRLLFWMATRLVGSFLIFILAFSTTVASICLGQFGSFLGLVVVLLFVSLVQAVMVPFEIRFVYQRGVRSNIERFLSYENVHPV